MTQEDKNLLLIDLCARLPYGVKLNTLDGVDTLGNVDTNEGWINASYDVDEVKPYLRSMSSMTEEEKTKYRNIVPGIEWNYGIQFPTTNKMDWLNAHHFDYRGLIEKSLALEAKEGIYEKKKA